MWSRAAQYGFEVGPASSRWKDQVIFRDLFQPKLDSVFDRKLSLSVGEKNGSSRMAIYSILEGNCDQGEEIKGRKIWKDSIIKISMIKKVFLKSQARRMPVIPNIAGCIQDGKGRLGRKGAAPSPTFKR